MIERTLALIKPDAVKNGDFLLIFERINRHLFGIRIVAYRTITFTPELAGEFYAEHVDKPFFDTLVAFMCSGPSKAILLDGPNAVSRWRAFMGATDPRNAAPNTIRGLFGNKNGLLHENAVHGSATIDDAKREIVLLFPGADL